ncbi:MAG: hypothetical protein KGN01_02645 [Patescibacteria group bacterium]|nr:hypothetical protein [Patescibacteria group bacterium]
MPGGMSPDRDILIFLAGPVRGGGDWQMQCVNLIMERYLPLSSQFRYCCVAIPSHYPRDHSLRQYEVESHDLARTFQHQTLWERYYLSMAAQMGCILFWLPCESREHPRDSNDGPYARETRGELGEWRAHMAYNPKLKMVVGAEAEFPGLKQIQLNFDTQLRCSFQIHNTLEATVAAAMEHTLSH